MEGNWTIDEWLSNIRFGQPRSYGGMDVYPVYNEKARGVEYLTMGEALKRDLLTVTEVSESGSVPELKVVSRAEQPVLIIAGEQLIGSKQDRVSTTTILVPPKESLRIPVNCTEAGRWSYTSREFTEPNFVMSAKLREKKSDYVAQSLKNGRGFLGDQSAVWRDIEEVNKKAGAQSPSDAMKAGFDAKRSDIDEYTAAFRKMRGQKGVLVAIGGEVVGLEVFSTEHACRKFYPKIIRSYALDAILSAEHGRAKSNRTAPQDFLARARFCNRDIYPSVGLGRDVRLSGGGLTGSALEYQGELVYLALFAGHRPDHRRREAAW